MGITGEGRRGDGWKEREQRKRSIKTILKMLEIKKREPRLRKQEFILPSNSRVQTTTGEPKSQELDTAGHGSFTLRKHRQTPAWPSFSFLFSLEPQPIECCAPHLRLVFPPQDYPFQIFPEVNQITPTKQGTWATLDHVKLAVLTSAEELLLYVSQGHPGRQPWDLKPYSEQ